MKLSVEFPSVAYREGPEGAKWVARAIEEIGFEWGAINVTAVFQFGARKVDALINKLAEIHRRLQAATA